MKILTEGTESAWKREEHRNRDASFVYCAGGPVRNVTSVIAPTPAIEGERITRTEEKICRIASVVTKVVDDSHTLLNEPISAYTDRTRRDGNENEKVKVETTVTKRRPERLNDSQNQNQRIERLASPRREGGTGNGKCFARRIRCT